MAVGAALVPATPSLSAPLVVGYAAVLGTGIDVDHFLLARFNRGDWRVARRALSDPRVVVLDQQSLLEEGDVYPFQRLGSHLAIAAVLTAGTWWWRPALGAVTAAVLYAHLVADVAWESYRREPAAWGR